MKTIQHFTFVCVMAMSIIACQKRAIDFSYSPSCPKAGDSITFTNLSDEGDSWLWEFGDGASSTLKCPKRAYKRAGTFLVTLTVDNKKELKASHTITVYDTMPVITTDSVAHYMTLTTFTPIIYNPYNYKIRYEWHFSENVFGDDIKDGIATVRTPKVYFMEKNITEKVRLIVEINQKIYEVEEEFYIYDTPAPALLYTTNTDSLFVQRTFEKGWEDPLGQDISHAGYFMGNMISMAANNDILYIFRGDSSASGKIYRYNLGNQNIQTIISNGETGVGYGFYYGILHKDSLYWTDAHGTLYRCSTQASNLSFQAGKSSTCFYADATMLPYGLDMGEVSGGISIYTNNLILWSYGNSVYLFYPNELGSSTHVQQAILNSNRIKQLQVDRMNKKVYFFDNGLWVVNIANTEKQLIDANATGAFYVDNTSNYLYYAHKDSIIGMPLLNRNSDASLLKKTTINHLKGVTAITKDNISRK